MILLCCFFNDVFFEMRVGLDWLGISLVKWFIWLNNKVFYNDYWIVDNCVWGGNYEDGVIYYYLGFVVVVSYFIFFLGGI